MPNIKKKIRNIRCESCGKHFKCYAELKDKCWCMELDNITIDSRFSDCLCIACLEKRKVYGLQKVDSVKKNQKIN